MTNFVQTLINTGGTSHSGGDSSPHCCVLRLAFLMSMTFVWSHDQAFVLLLAAGSVAELFSRGSWWSAPTSPVFPDTFSPLDQNVKRDRNRSQGRTGFLRHPKFLGLSARAALSGPWTRRLRCTRCAGAETRPGHTAGDGRTEPRCRGPRPGLTQAHTGRVLRLSRVSPGMAHRELTWLQFT